jgi:hypothetical protein
MAHDYPCTSQYSSEVDLFSLLLLEILATAVNGIYKPNLMQRHAADSQKIDRLQPDGQTMITSAIKVDLMSPRNMHMTTDSFNSS